MTYLLYGAYGYTGRLIAQMAVERGQRPVLAGRDAERLAAVADDLGLDHVACALDDPAALDAALADVPVVLHCAGPFIRTAEPMIEACLRTGTQYLDITGESAVFEKLAALDARVKAAGIMLLPGVGFDVVPTDCLALHLKNRLPSAQHLDLAILGHGGLSRGTVNTFVELIDEGGAVRRAGRLERVPAAWKTRTADFGSGPVEAVSLPWGDIVTAYHSTGIPNITVYAALGKSLPLLIRLTRYTGWLLATAPAQALIKALISRMAAGPSDDERARGQSFVWGTAWDDEGRRATARLTGPEGYDFTALAALTCAQKVVDGQAAPGFQTPAKLFGADFVLDIEGVKRQDLDP